MNILIPVDDKQNISYIKESKGWSVITLDNGNKIDEKKYSSKDDIKELVDFVVVKDKNEDVDDFLDEDIRVLVALSKMDVDEVVEAFIFRELFELGG